MAQRLLGFMRSNTIAFIALFIALGGTSYAATTLAANSVGTKQLKKSAVTAVKIKSRAVTAAKLAAGAVKTGAVANDAITGDKVLESSLAKVPSAANADTIGGLSPAVFGTTMRFSGTDFRAVNSSTAFTYEYMGEVSCAGGDFYAPVRLPQGAVVTGLTMYYNDVASVSAGNLWLTRFNLNGGYTDLLFIGAPVDSGRNSASAAVTTQPVIDNTSYAYVLIWRANSASGYLGGAQLTYAMPTAATATTAPHKANPIQQHSQP